MYLPFRCLARRADALAVEHDGGGDNDSEDQEGRAGEVGGDAEDRPNRMELHCVLVRSRKSRDGTGALREGKQFNGCGVWGVNLGARESHDIFYRQTRNNQFVFLGCGKLEGAQKRKLVGLRARSRNRYKELKGKRYRGRKDLQDRSTEKEEKKKR